MKNWIPLLALGLLAGCATSKTLESRKQERYAAYEELTPEMRTNVDHGHIEVGLSMDAVYIAWGPPDQATEGESEAGKTMTWTYYGFYTQQMTTWAWGRPYFNSYPVNYIRAQVVFTNGIVKHWQTFPPPG